MNTLTGNQAGSVSLPGASPALEPDGLADLMATTLQGIQAGVVFYSAGGRILYANQALEQIGGWAPEGFPGAGLDEVFQRPDGAGGFSACLPAVGESARGTLLNQAGEAISVHLSVLAPPGAGEDGPRVLILRGDAEEAMARKVRSLLMANITHEFRTPLSALNASMEFLLDEMTHLSPAELKQLLGSIHLSVTGLQTLIDNLLESISIESGWFAIHPEAIEIGEVIAAALEVMRPLLTRRRQQVVLDLAPVLPAVYADPVRLRQVMVNLLSNASKYGPVADVITVSAGPVAGGFLRVSVRDHGPGILPSEQARLFQRFQPVRTRDGPQYGIGLGLSVVRAIVQGHGGQVGLGAAPAEGQPQPGVPPGLPVGEPAGSTFWFTVPLEGERDESADRRR